MWPGVGFGAGTPLPTKGKVLLTVNDFDKGAILKIARDLHCMDFKLIATAGTAELIERNGLPVEVARKVDEGGHHIAKMVASGEIDLIINTPLGQTAHDDSRAMRSSAVLHDVPLLTTLSAAQAAVNGIRALRANSLQIRSVQQHYE